MEKVIPLSPVERPRQQESNGAGSIHDTTFSGMWVPSPFYQSFFTVPLELEMVVYVCGVGRREGGVLGGKGGGACTWEDGLPQQQLSHDTAHRPDIDGGGVLRGAEDKLGRPVKPRADIADIGLPRHQHLQKWPRLSIQTALFWKRLIVPWCNCLDSSVPPSHHPLTPQVCLFPAK